MKKISLLITFFFIPMITSFAAIESTSSPKEAHAVLGGGCFWCMEALFQKLSGVIAVQSGFAGGRTKNPSYEEVSCGDTGHAEVIEITYDSTKISYDQLLDFFWRAHDPTTLNQQGADIGPQYRSMILTTSLAQQQKAETSKKKAQAYFLSPIVTEILPLTHFYPAEKYHQKYFENNRLAPYCRAVIAPKLKKLQME